MDSQEVQDGLFANTSRRMDFRALPSPSFVIDEELVRANLAVLARVQEASGCRILLALKGFACFHLFAAIRETLTGVCASSAHEARLAREFFGGELHVFAPAYSEDDIRELPALADHLVFNSFAQWQRFGARVRAAKAGISCGIRINPEHSETAVALYDPCAPGSRLGVRRTDFRPDLLSGISGLHFHSLCEKDAPALSRTIAAVEAKFGDFLGGMDWLNCGGGHLITRPGYDIELLIHELVRLRERYRLQVYLEPGAAVVLDAGFLITTVLDVLPGAPPVAILDVSVAAHMPDVLEMPYRPEIVGAGMPGERPHTFRLGGISCLAGDVAGDYSFDQPLVPGNRLIFCDMAQYSMVKTTFFNGVRHPAIAVRSRSGGIKVVRRFGYEDFKNRLG